MVLGIFNKSKSNSPNIPSSRSPSDASSPDPIPNIDQIQLLSIQVQQQTLEDDIQQAQKSQVYKSSRINLPAKPNSRLRVASTPMSRRRNSTISLHSRDSRDSQRINKKRPTQRKRVNTCPYPINDIIDIESSFDDQEGEFPEGFEQVTREERIAEPNSNVANVLGASPLLNQRADTLNEDYPTQTQAISCILERTGSTARNNRRGGRGGAHGRSRVIERRQNVNDTRSDELRSAIISRLNQRIDPSIEEEAPPPLDEYKPENSPPYRENLHRKTDLISFDPRYSIPILRLNKRLIKNNKNLTKVIKKLIKLNCIPDEVNVWDLNRIDDGEFHVVLPEILAEYEVAQRQQREAREAEELQRAIALSIAEHSQQELFRGFRYNQPRTEQELQYDSSGDEFIDVDDEVVNWSQSNSILLTT